MGDTFSGAIVVYVGDSLDDGETEAVISAFVEALEEEFPGNTVIVSSGRKEDMDQECMYGENPLAGLPDLDSVEEVAYDDRVSSFCMYRQHLASSCNFFILPVNPTCNAIFEAGMAHSRSIRLISIIDGRSRSIMTCSGNVESVTSTDSAIAYVCWLLSN